jgi:hypothetical protein
VVDDENALYLESWIFVGEPDKQQVLMCKTSDEVDIGACHCKNGILYRAFLKDANRMSVPALEGWSIHNEGTVQWKRFLVKLKAIFGNAIDNEDMVFISDQQKGLERALAEVLPKAPLFMCQKHLGAEVTMHCGQSASAHVLSMANCTRHADFNDLWETAPEKLKKYLADKDKKEWARLHAPVCLHGSVASTVSNSEYETWQPKVHHDPTKSAP